jgi:enoyl-CoA hydratase
MVVREDSGDVAVIRLAHKKVSALDLPLCEALVHAIGDVASGQWRALVVTGTGATFSAGVDLFQVLDGGPTYLTRFLPAMESLFRAFLTFPKPAVAAINGHAIAGGCIIAAACDHRIMADGAARIGIPELAVGVPFPALPFEIMRARLSPPHFRRLVFGADTLLPADALNVGLIDEIGPAELLMSRALAAAQRLTSIPTLSFSLMKRAVTAPVLAHVDAARSLNDEALAAWRSPAVLARIRAYLEETVRKK